MANNNKDQRSLIIYGYEDPINLMKIVDKLPLSVIEDICKNDMAVLASVISVNTEIKKHASEGSMLIDLFALIDYVSMCVTSSMFMHVHNCTGDQNTAKNINERCKFIMDILGISPRDIIFKQYKSSYMTSMIDTFDTMDDYKNMNGSEFLVKVSGILNNTRNEHIKKMLKDNNLNRELDPRDCEVKTSSINPALNDYLEEAAKILKAALDECDDNVDDIMNQTKDTRIKAMTNILKYQSASSNFTDEDNMKIVKFLEYCKTHDMIAYWLAIDNTSLRISSVLADLKLSNQFKMVFASDRSKYGFVTHKCRIEIEQFVVDHILWHVDVWTTNNAYKSTSCRNIPHIEMTFDEYLTALKSRHEYNTIVENHSMAMILKRVKSGVIMALRTVRFYRGKNVNPFKTITIPVVYCILHIKKEDKDAKRTNMGKDNMEKS